MASNDRSNSSCGATPRVRQRDRGRSSAWGAHRSPLGRITVDDWWDQWWPTVTNLRPSTRARDEQFYRTHVRPIFGSTPLGKLDRTVLRAWVADLGSPDGSDLAPATIHRVVQVLNKCVNAAFEDRLIPHNPVAKLPLPRIERREMRFLDVDDIWKLADEIDESYRSFVLLGAFGGLRLGEMLGLRWKRLDLLRRQVHVAETLVSIGAHISFGPPKTKAAVRTVPLPDSCARSCPVGRPAGRSRRLGLPVARRISRQGRRCSVDASGSRRCPLRDSSRSEFTTFDTQRCRCGSPRERTPTRRRHGRPHIGLGRPRSLWPSLPAAGRRTHGTTRNPGKHRSPSIQPSPDS